jgi:hypothetical protein
MVGREPGAPGLKINLFSGDGVVEIQKLGMKEISSIAWEAGGAELHATEIGFNAVIIF